MREIRRLKPADINAYTEIAMNAYPSYKDLTEEGLLRYKQNVRRIMETDDDVLFFGLFEEGELICVARYFRFYMNLFGSIVITGGLGFLGVHLLHKKKKAAFELITHFEQWCKEEGITLALLLPFRPDFYKSMGYGFGTKTRRYSIETKYIPAYRGEDHLRLFTPSDIPLFLRYQERLLSSTHGLIAKIGDEIESLRKDKERKTVMSLDESGTVEGYLSFRFSSEHPHNYTVMHIVCDELFYDSPQVLQKLLGFLRRQEDQVRRVVFHTQIEDFHYLFNNPLDGSDHYIANGNLQITREYIGTMYKILSAEDAFTDFAYRSYPEGELSVAFHITDEKGELSEELHVRFENGKAERTKDAAELTLRLRRSDFSSLFVGCVSLKTLIALGLAQTDQPEKLEQLSALLHIEDKPVNNTDY